MLDPEALAACFVMMEKLDHVPAEASLPPDAGWLACWAVEKRLTAAMMARDQRFQQAAEVMHEDCNCQQTLLAGCLAAPVAADQLGYHTGVVARCWHRLQYSAGPLAVELATAVLWEGLAAA